jgi:CDGSH-type Zn-finger protein
MFIRQVNECPSGRLVAWDNASGEPVEQALPVSIGLIEDPAQQCSGPLWLQRRIPIVAAEGHKHEVRNRVTLCRCGAAKNKPFCDSTHAAIKFRACHDQRASLRSSRIAEEGFSGGDGR